MAKTTNKEIFVGGLAEILKEQLKVDVQLKAKDSDEDGSAMAVHKLILAARSAVFKVMFESDEMKTSGQLETITISEMNHEELEAFIEFIYSDGSLLSAKAIKHVRSLYVAAYKYDIPHLRDLNSAYRSLRCGISYLSAAHIIFVYRNELILSLNSSNALNILQLAQIPFDETLNHAAFNNVITNMSTITSSHDFKLFVIKHPNLTVEIMKTFLTRKHGYCKDCCPY